MILLENEYVTVEHDAQHCLLISVWKKYIPSAVYRQMVIFIFETLVKTQACKNLSDVRNLPTISPEDAHWTAETSKKYYPLICQGKTYTSAIVLAKTTLTKLALSSMIEEVKITYQDIEVLRKFFPLWEISAFGKVMLKSL